MAVESRVGARERPKDVVDCCAESGGVRGPRSVGEFVPAVIVGLLYGATLGEVRGECTGSNGVASFMRAGSSGVVLRAIGSSTSP